jgi:hypothetical protein
MSSITLGGVRDVDLGFRVLEESQEPLAPSTRDKTMIIDGNHGAYDFGAELEAKPFTYKCAFIPNGTTYSQPSAQELQRYVRRLAEHLTDRTGRPRNIKLQRAFEPDKYYIARYSGSAPLERIAYNSLGMFTLPLIAFDPFAYANIDQIYQDVITVTPWTVWIESEGNVSTPCVIELTNEGTETINHFKIAIEYRVEG